MNLKNINKQIKEVAKTLPVNLCQKRPEDLSIDAIVSLQTGINASANLVEDANAVIKLLAEEVQNLRDENAELKGEKPKPDIRPQSKPKDGDEKGNEKSNDESDKANSEDDQDSKQRNISSEHERKTPQERKPRFTNKDIKITKTEIVTLDRTELPTDLQFKGYQTYVVQDIVFALNNIEYKREEYYSPSQNRSYVAPLPIDYNGCHYGYNVKALIIALHHGSKMTQPAIHQFLLTTYGLQIAKSTISCILTDNYDIHNQEKTDIVSAGLLATTYAHYDDTGGRMNGQNQYVHILCSPQFTAYFTRPHKDRMTVLEILGQGIVKHVFDETTYELMHQFGVSDKLLSTLKPALQNEMSTQDLTTLLEQLLPNTHATAKKQIIEASAIIAYRQLPHAIQILVCDDAPQFKDITELLALCWVHAGRHYKKLNPVIPEHKKLTNEFIAKLWEYYHKLLAYKANPLSSLQLSLSLGFDELFSTVTGYNELDERIAKTKSQKESLLVVLEHPEVPLHNNPAELGARAQARRRDISLQTQNTKGTTAKDNWMTIIETAVKLKINVFAYIKDRISKVMKMPSLAELIGNAPTFVNSG